MELGKITSWMTLVDFIEEEFYPFGNYDGQ